MASTGDIETPTLIFLAWRIFVAPLSCHFQMAVPLTDLLKASGPGTHGWHGLL